MALLVIDYGWSMSCSGSSPSTRRVKSGPPPTRGCASSRTGLREGPRKMQVPENYAETPDGLLLIADVFSPMSIWDGIRSRDGAGRDHPAGVGRPRLPHPPWGPRPAPTSPTSASWTTGTTSPTCPPSARRRRPRRTSPSPTRTCRSARRPRWCGGQILRNTAGEGPRSSTSAVDTTDLVTTTFAESLTDATLATGTQVALFDLQGFPLANSHGVPPAHKAVIAHHLGRMFATVERTYRQGNVIVTNGSTAVDRRQHRLDFQPRRPVPLRRRRTAPPTDRLGEHDGPDPRSHRELRRALRLVSAPTASGRPRRRSGSFTTPRRGEPPVVAGHHGTQPDGGRRRVDGPDVHVVVSSTSSNGGTSTASPSRPTRARTATSSCRRCAAASTTAAGRRGGHGVNAGRSRHPRLQPGQSKPISKRDPKAVPTRRGKPTDQLAGQRTVLRHPQPGGEK